MIGPNEKKETFFNSIVIIVNFWFKDYIDFFRKERNNNSLSSVKFE